MMKIYDTSPLLVTGGSIYDQVKFKNNLDGVLQQPPTCPQPGGARQERETYSFSELLAHLEHIGQRLPLVNTACECDGIRPKASKTASPLDSNSDDTSEDESDVRLRDILKTVELYRKRSDHKKINTVKNLISNYTCKEDVSDSEVQQIYKYIDSEDETALVEMGWMVLLGICAKENNVFKLLFHDVVIKIFKALLQYQNETNICETAALTLAKVLECEEFSELWMEFMMAEGLRRILSLCCLPHSPAVRLAAAEVLKSLALYKDMAVLLIDQAMEVLNELKVLNSECQEVFTEILINLLGHTDYTRQSVLDIDTLPTAQRMLQQGPCKAQCQALVLISALAQSEIGLKAILEAGMIPFVMSAMVDSQCRKVTMKSATCMNCITKKKKVPTATLR